MCRRCSDESIIVKGQGTIFLGGPPLVQAATGEVVSAEDLGGADVHSRISGVTDHYASDDRHALGIARRIVANLNRGQAAPLAVAPPREPLYPPRRSTASSRPTCGGPTTCARSSPASSTAASSTSSSSSTARPWCAASRGSGAIPVGILANNGILFSESALKGAHFIELCCPARHPAGVSAEHHRLHGRAQIRECRASPRTAPRW